jgi:selenocysteine lyase/cysteine desulfurase
VDLRPGRHRIPLCKEVPHRLHLVADGFRRHAERRHPAANLNAISEALVFNDNIGIDRKAARLRYLRDRWALRLAQNPKCKILHSPDPAQSCGIGFLAFNGIDPGKIGAALVNKYSIYTSTMGHEEYTGLRITPNIYTTLKEIDVFADAVEREVKIA